jgi:N utilization substance protein B
MQLIYAIESSEDVSINSSKCLDTYLKNTERLFIFLLYFINEVALYARKDAVVRASKNLPTPEDLQVSTKIASNTLLEQLRANKEFEQQVKETKPQLIESNEIVRNMYAQLVQTPAYLEYIAKPERDKKSERDILLFLFTNVLLPNEDFQSFMEDQFSNWNDDADMMSILVTSYFKKPSSYHFKEIISKEKQTFAHELLQTTFNKKEVAIELIKPRLKNWEAERIAAIDMILLRMGVCELLYFETIPSKVTLNEYIDIAKEYSTDQSGQFINGILDNIHKELLQKQQINKIDFKPKIS